MKRCDYAGHEWMDRPLVTEDDACANDGFVEQVCGSCDAYQVLNAWKAQEGK